MANLFKIFMIRKEKKKQTLLLGGNFYSRKAQTQYRQLHLTLLPGVNFDLDIIPGRCEFLRLFFHLKRKLELQTLFCAGACTHFQRKKEGGSGRLTGESFHIFVICGVVLELVVNAQGYPLRIRGFYTLGIAFPLMGGRRLLSCTVEALATRID